MQGQSCGIYFYAHFFCQIPVQLRCPHGTDHRSTRAGRSAAPVDYCGRTKEAESHFGFAAASRPAQAYEAAHHNPNPVNAPADNCRNGAKPACNFRNSAKPNQRFGPPVRCRVGRPDFVPGRTGCGRAKDGERHRTTLPVSFGIINCASSRKTAGWPGHPKNRAKERQRRPLRNQRLCRQHFAQNIRQIVLRFFSRRFVL